jgi:hypothetical protein
MGPIVLFDKSFLQSLSLDESVWFGHFFMPVMCPLFYVETLADLEKAVREGRTPEQEVGIIASKFPELSGGPCMYHGNLVVHELLGQTVPMDGRIPRARGRPVVRDGKQGVVYDESPEAEAFSRWQRGRFLEIERDMATDWRAALRAIDLQSVAKNLRDIGIDASTCRSPEDARAMARAVVSGHDKPFARIAMVMFLLDVPRQYQAPIIERWKISGYRPLIEHAPYTAHVLAVELFFQFALGAHLIGTRSASNRVDIAYLYYLPFCMMFTSGDDLHRKCAPLFLRPGQEFVWGLDLKQDLARINSHFMALPDAEKERGIMAFAHAPPKVEGSVVRQLRAKFMGPGYDDEAPVKPPPEDDAKSEKLVRELREWTNAPTAPAGFPSGEEYDPQMMAIQRMVRKKKGSWWQLPKDLHDEPIDE